MGAPRLGVWMHVEDGLDAIAEHVCAEFAVDADTARADATELIDELTANGLLTELG